MSDRSAWTGEPVDNFEGDRDDVILLATDIWRLREFFFPDRVRRMNPDAIDMATGAWSICLKEALDQIAARQTRS